MELGGPLMWPILACSVGLGGVLVERAWTVGVRGLWRGEALSGRAWWWHRRVMPFFLDVPPTLGLLGTVLGLTQAFGVTESGADPQRVSSGLGVAVLTTVLGLAVALPASCAGYVLDWVAFGRAEAPAA
jgi:biopolymer transport protein ExbB